MTIREEKQKLETEAKFKEVTEGLTDTQVEKLATLSEGISFESVEEYASKVAAIKDSYFAETVAPVEDATELLEEAAEEEEATKVVVDPQIAAYAASLGRLAS